MKSVSVIIPCRNGESCLSYCVDSLLRQTIGIRNLELILVDDASTDKTLEKMLEYEKLYPDDILILPLEENIMLGAARNLAFTYATGEYTAYLDSDDWLTDDALQKVYGAAVRYDCDVVEFLNRDVCSYEEAIRAQENAAKRDETPVTGILGTAAPGDLVILDTVEKRKEFIISERSTLGCWNKLYRTSMLKERRLKYAEGVAFEEPAFTYPLRFYEKRHYFLRECLHFCYQSPGGVTRSLAMREKHKYDHLKVHYDLQLEMRERGLLENYRDEIEFYFFHAFFFESLLLMIGRGFFADVGTVRWMQETMRAFFPDFKENLYLNQERFQSHKLLSAFVEIEVNEENIGWFNGQWKEIVKMCTGVYPE